MKRNYFFPSRHPIYCCQMTQVTHDLRFAVAIANAGGMPSFDPYFEDYQDYQDNLVSYKKITGNLDIVISVTESMVSDINFIEKNLTDLKIKFLEIRRSDIFDLESLNNFPPNSNLWYNKKFLKNVEFLKKHDVKIIRRCLKKPIDGFGLTDAIGVKGKESAGFSSDISIKHMIELQKEQTPDVEVFPIGGVSSPKDVYEFLNLGCPAVGVGTLFAASKESCLDIKTKEFMVQKSNKDLTLLEDTKQNALIIDSNDLEKKNMFGFNDLNRSESLALGVKGKGGHIYAGHSIDGVTEIRTVKQVIEYLISDIK